MKPNYEISQLNSLPILSINQDQLNTNDIYEMLAEFGAFIVRDSIKSALDFSQFVKSHSSKLSLDPARTMTGNAAQEVDAGTQSVGLHCENGNSPFWPDLTWFYCEQAPLKGSQTTVCDGVKVFQNLSIECQNFFTSGDIRYSRKVESDKWRRLVCYYNTEIKNINDVGINHLLSLVENDQGTHIEYDSSNDSIQYQFKVSAILKSTFSDSYAFANSILGPSYNYEKPVIDMADGRKIPAHFLEEIKRVTATFTYPAGWQDHDVIIIDNKRVMHGREEIIDSRRKIFNALSYRK